MLPKRSRLTASEVRAILKGGRSVRLGALSVKYVPAAEPKAAVVVGSKVAKSAVARNRLRRSAYAALGEALPKKIHLVVFLQKPEFNAADLTELCSKLS